MATKKNLLNWYNTNLKISRLDIKEDRRKLNSFWIRWEKSKLMIKRLRFVN